MATDGAALVEGRAGITFGVEAVVDRCGNVGIYPGPYWFDWLLARCCGKPSSSGKRCT